MTETIVIGALAWAILVCVSFAAFLLLHRHNGGDDQ